MADEPRDIAAPANAAGDAAELPASGGPDGAPASGPAANATAAAVTAASGAAAVGPRRRRRAARWGVGLLLVVLALAAGLAGFVWWGLRTEAGSGFLVRQLPYVHIEGGHGSLLGDYAAERLTVSIPGSGAQLILVNPRWRNLRVGRTPDSHAWLRLRIDELAADRAEWVAGTPTESEPLKAPESLRLPLEMEIGAIRVGEVHAAALGERPLRELRGAIHLGKDRGAEHRIDGLGLSWDGLAASGSLRIQTGGDMAVDAKVTLAPLAGKMQESVETGGRSSGGAAGPLAAASTSTGAGEGSAARASAGNRASQANSAPTAMGRDSPGEGSAVRGGNASRQGSADAAPASLDALLARFDWRAEATLSGPLKQPAFSAALRTTDRQAAANGSTAAATAAGQSLDAAGVLRPFEPWPLGDLRATVSALDLSTLHSAAPRTALSGSILATTRGLDRPADVRVTLANPRAGRWSDGLLPLRDIALTAHGRPDTPRVVELSGFEAKLGAAAQPAGRIEGKGRLAPETWSLDLLLAEVQPARLDARAADMRLSGPVRLGGSLPTSSAAPGPATGSAPVRQSTAGPRAPAASAAAPPGGASAAARSPAFPAPPPLVGPGQPTTLEAKAELRGSLAALPGRSGGSPAVVVELDAGLRSGAAGALHVDLRRLAAAAGDSRATLSGKVDRAGTAAPWQVAADAALADFDPVAWWPGAPGSAWQQGRHRINAQARVALDVPQPAAPVARAGGSRSAGPTLGQQLAGLGGEALLTLAPSQLAGVPLSGKLQLRSAPGGALRAELALDAAGNRVGGDGVIDLASIGGATAHAARDRWNLALDAPALNRLAPLWRLAPSAGAAPLQVAGAVTGNAQIDGRWPDVNSSGHFDASGVRAGSARLDKATARWQLGTASGAPVDVQATLDGLAVGDAVVESGRLALAGTARAHRLELSARSSALPPAWTDALQASAPAGGAAAAATLRAAAQGGPPAAAGRGAARSELVLQVQGGLVEGNDPAAAGALGAIGWRGNLQRLEARSTATPDAPWLRVADVGIETAWAPGAPRATVQPGRAQLQLGATAAALRWQRVAWQAAAPATPTTAATPQRLDAEAELEPLAVAPILALLQPDFGWGGDLAVSGTLSVRSAPTVKADVVLERRRGDLHVSDEYGTQKLGLTDLRLGLAVNEGVWSFTQALAGTTVGVAAGAIVARTSPGATWPPPQTPVQGVVELDVANLGTWGPWVPAGWRLGGKLHVNAGVGGRVSAPELTGSLQGSGITVRNFLEGVNVRDGDVAIALQGTTARIDRFTAKAGEGSLDVTGNAQLGDAPRAQLQVTAEKFQLLGRVDRRIVTSGRASLRIDEKRLAVDGNFTVDEGLIDFSRGDAPTLSSDVVVIRTAAAEAARKAAPDAAALPGSASKPGGKAPAADKPAPRNVALDLRVDLGNQLRLRGRGIDTGLAGELRITSPGGQPAVGGAVRTVGGTYNAYGQKLVIDRGTITFNGAIGNPRLDILATRANSDVRVGVSVTGLALGPRVRLFSEPEMSETDKLSWLVLGRASDSLGRTDTALLQRAALALVSGEGEGKGDQLTRTLGLDELSVRQREEGDVRATVISLGKQLSSRWYIGYEQGLNSTVGGFQLIYRIARRFTLRAQTGRNNSLDLIWSLRSGGTTGTTPVNR